MRSLIHSWTSGTAVLMRLINLRLAETKLEQVNLPNCLVIVVMISLNWSGSAGIDSTAEYTKFIDLRREELFSKESRLI